MFFWKKERQIERVIEDYLKRTESCLCSFGEACELYFRDGLSGKFESLVNMTHEHERQADDLRRDIEQMMYDKALIPESRGDILGMLEAIDLIPNRCESILFQVLTQSMSVPREFVSQFRELIRINMEAFRLLCTAMRNLFGKVDLVIKDASRVTEIEGQSDVIERLLIKAIFDSGMDKADMILLKELVLEIGGISDRSENASDRLRNIAVKRQS